MPAENPNSPNSTKRSKGFSPVGRHLDKRLRKLWSKRGFAGSDILQNWREIVGDDVADITYPVQMRYRQMGGAVLVVDCLSAHASELAMRSGEIIDRINHMSGMASISRIEWQHQHIGFQSRHDGACAGDQAVHEASKFAERGPVPEELTKSLENVSDAAFRASLKAVISSYFGNSDEEKRE